MNKRSGQAVAALGLWPVSALAHPGDHGHSWLAALFHLLTEPDHLLLAAFGVVAAVLLRRLWLARRQR